MTQLLDPKKPKIAIVGAGASALMCADVLKNYNATICVFEQLPSAGRKILWAGKTGLNISHSEPIERFVARYTPKNKSLIQLVKTFDSAWLMNWTKSLGIETFVGSSGRIFPVQMKASKLLRAWLDDLTKHGVQFFYHHKCVDITQNTLTLEHTTANQTSIFCQTFDAIILACGGLSYPKLGSTGDWQAWIKPHHITPMYASNVGICRCWSAFLHPFFGQPLKRVGIRVGDKVGQGDIIVTHYGFESGLIYQLNLSMRCNLVSNKINLVLDLLPDVDEQKIHTILTKNPKLSLTTRLNRAGLDKLKIALLRECTRKSDWQNPYKMAQFIKALPIVFDGFRPIDEAISTGGGVKFSALHNFSLVDNPYVFCTGEMLDFDAPTGGYLLTACFALGRGCGQSVADFLKLTPIGDISL